MTDDTNARADGGLGPAAHCGSYRPGHEVNFSQAKLSWEHTEHDRRATVRAVADDGTITFADGSTLWHHEPERLRAAVERYGPNVLLGGYGVLKVPNRHNAYYFSVGDEPTPCPGPAEPPATFEDVAHQLLERGGVMIPGREALRLADEHRAREHGR